MNMAIDEALLETAVVPSIRFYRWHSPALSFGYFGKFSDVAIYAAERDLVRRWTGGGIVFHGDDLTYSIVIPASDPVFGESSIVDLRKNSSRFVRSFGCQRQDAELAGVAAAVERRNQGRTISRSPSGGLETAAALTTVLRESGSRRRDD